MKKNELKSLYEGVAANKIAREWLNFAQQCIVKDGHRPAKLSDTVFGYALGEWGTGGLMEAFGYSRASRDRIAAAALTNARQRLRDGEYPEVAKFFAAS